MKKELLIASALVGTVGVAGVAEAASASYSGHVRNGITWKDSDGTADGTFAANQQGSFSVSITETTDGGVDISTGLGLADEGAGSDADSSGLTLTFPSGVKLDLIEAGNAYASHLASVPGATGEQGIGGSTTLTAPSGLGWADSSNNAGFEIHSADDAFGVEGLKAGFSASVGDDTADSGSTVDVESSYSVGLSYVTTSGDTTLTVGGGMVYADDSNTSSQNAVSDSMAVALTAATGNLTVGFGLSTGDGIAMKTTETQNQELDSVEVMTAGLSYVSGDMTLALGYANGDAKDANVGTAAGASTESYTDTSASVTWAVPGASGVSAIIGYSDRDRSTEGTSSTDHSGDSFYVGALVSF
jgi:hypothetical protein